MAIIGEAKIQGWTMAVQKTRPAVLLKNSRASACLETSVRFFARTILLFYCLLFLLSTVYNCMLPQWRNKG